MTEYQDLTGKVFSRLTVVGYAYMKSGKRYWYTRCTCGTERAVRGSKMTMGLTVSCGCYHREQVSERNRRHGKYGSPTYLSWRSMLSRCYVKKHRRYVDYGGRGITVCERWRASFEAFLEDMGERPDDKTLDRIDVQGNYEPGNCRWATKKQQRKNRRDSK